MALPDSASSAIPK